MFMFFNYYIIYIIVTVIREWKFHWNLNDKCFHGVTFVDLIWVFLYFTFSIFIEVIVILNSYEDEKLVELPYNTFDSLNDCLHKLLMVT